MASKFAVVKTLRTDLSGLPWSNKEGLSIGIDEKDTWKVYSTVSGNHNYSHFSVTYMLLGPPKGKTILKQGVPTIRSNGPTHAFP
jgi:hypothetical protein